MKTIYTIGMHMQELISNIIHANNNLNVDDGSNLKLANDTIDGGHGNDEGKIAIKQKQISLKYLAHKIAHQNASIWERINRFYEPNIKFDPNY